MQSQFVWLSVVETASVYDDDCELLNCNRNIFNAGNKLAGSLAPVWRNHRAAHLATSSLVTNGNMHEIGQWYYSAATQHMRTLTWLMRWGLLLAAMWIRTYFAVEWFSCSYIK